MGGGNDRQEDSPIASQGPGPQRNAVQGHACGECRRCRYASGIHYTCTWRKSRQGDVVGRQSVRVASLTSWTSWTRRDGCRGYTTMRAHTHAPGKEGP